MEVLAIIGKCVSNPPHTAHVFAAAIVRTRTLTRDLQGLYCELGY